MDLRRLVWFALFASAGLGLFTMLFRFSAGDSVSLNDFGIQAGALVLFSALLWFDRNRGVEEGAESEVAGSGSLLGDSVSFRVQPQTNLYRSVQPQSLRSPPDHW